MFFHDFSIRALRPVVVKELARVFGRPEPNQDMVMNKTVPIVVFLNGWG
jgi:hypothetical protein